MERTVGKLEGRMDGVEQRLERMEEKMDELLSTVHAARGGWRLLIALGTISAAIGGVITHFLHGVKP